MDLRSSLIRILTQARKRSVQHLLLEYLVLPATIVLGGAVVILLAGSAALSWLWLVALTIGSLASGLYLARKRFPSIYLVAQRIDERLKLADTLSTAAFFLESPGTSEATVREGQRLQAERLAASVDLKQALPLSRPRAFYAAIALAAGKKVPSAVAWDGGDQRMRGRRQGGVQAGQRAGEIGNLIRHDAMAEG